MAKRFIDTKLFDDTWFVDLKPNDKLFFVYLLTNCDHAGIIDLSLRIAEFKTGIKGLANSLVTVGEQFSKRLIHIRDNYYFMPKFVKFQYPKGLNPKVIAQKSVISRLKEFDLLEEDNRTVKQQLAKSCPTLIDTDIDIDTNKDMEINISFDKFWDLYDKKVDRSKCEPKWEKLKDSDREKIMSHIPKYKISQPDKQYRKNPETYLNRNSWENEIISNKPTSYREKNNNLNQTEQLSLEGVEIIE